MSKVQLFLRGERDRKHCVASTTSLKITIFHLFLSVQQMLAEEHHSPVHFTPIQSMRLGTFHHTHSASSTPGPLSLGVILSEELFAIMSTTSSHGGGGGTLPFLLLPTVLRGIPRGREQWRWEEESRCARLTQRSSLANKKGCF